MSGFKLIAVRPLEECSKHFLKNLNAGEIYQFYQDYKFIFDERDKGFVHQIEHLTQVPQDLFGRQINISAVVGMNGSGKSTIIELFCALIFCLSKQLNLIDIENFKKTHNLSSQEKSRLANDLNNFEKFYCEIYYELDNKVYCIKKSKQKFERIEFKSDIDSNSFKVSKDDSVDLRDLNSPKDLNKFLLESFYSILANYSIYGLNTNESGIWLKSIFHKNDGYQTPIVLNPMRTEGKIDINRLTDLSKSRLLGNVFKELEPEQKEEESLRCLVNNKVVNKIKLNLDLRKFIEVDEKYLKPDQNASYILDIGDKSIYLDNTEKYKNKHLWLLLKAFYPNIDNLKAKLNIDSTIKKVSIEYILSKAKQIVKKYPQFKSYSNKVFRANAKETTIQACFNHLANDYSHSTFKIRQAINFLVFDLYTFSNQTEKEFELSNASNLGISEIINNKINTKLNEVLEENKLLYKADPNTFDLEANTEEAYRKYNLINFLPPSFFDIDFEFKGNGFFKDLSSGEKQMIYSVNAIIYHLINLDSIYSMEVEDTISYRNYNIILDEIELYFHPEFQRNYIHELIKSISYIQKHNYYYNIIFLTHSPFILSDIPSTNILRLKDGNSKPEQNQNFGANIHDLLTNKFFLEKGFMGEFAKREINETINWINDEERDLSKQDYHKKVINLIGEPILQIKLAEMFDLVTNQQTELEIMRKRVHDLEKNSND